MRKELFLCLFGAFLIGPNIQAAGLGFKKQSASAEQLAPATFEDLGLAPDSYWRGDVDDPDYDYGSFRSGDFEFPNFYMSDYGTWAWYAYSSVAANNGTTWTDQFQSAPGGGHDSATFGVAYVDAYMGPSQVWVYGPNDEGGRLSSMWVTNGAWTRYCLLNGDGMSGPFETGDYLKVIVTGYDIDDEPTGTSEFFLADYRSENEEDHYVVSTWERMDLVSLGNIQYFEINMETTKVNAYGPTTPMYVCIDDITGLISGTDKVSDIPEESSSFCVNAFRGGIALNNPSGRQIIISSSDGGVVRQISLPEAEISLEKGIYIVTDGNTNVKVAVR